MNVFRWVIEQIWGKRCDRCHEHYRSDLCPCWQKRLYTAEVLDSSAVRGVYHSRTERVV